MTKAAARLVAVLAALAAGGQAALAEGTEPVAGPPARPAWIAAEGYAGYSGYAVPGPPWSWPLPSPRRGCYTFRQDIASANRQVVVCQ